MTPAARRLAPLAAAGVFVVLVLLHWSRGPEAEMADYAQYLLHVRALTEGHPYGDLGIIRTPFARWVGVPYPPGLPLMLLPVVAVVGFNGAILKLVMLLTGICFVLVAGAYFAREGWTLAVGVTLLVGLSTDLLHSSLIVLSDLPFAALVWLTLLLVDRPGPWTARRIVAVTLAGGAALSFRAAGVALLPVLLIYAIIHHRRLGFRPALPVAIWVAAAVAAALIFPIGDLGVMVPRFRWETVERLWERLPGLRLPVSKALLYPFPWGAANAAYHVVGAGLIGVGVAAFARRHGARCSLLFAAGYIIMLMLSPAGLGTRYLWPVYPLIVYGFLRGLTAVAQLGMRGKTPVAPGALAGGTAVVLALAVVPQHIGEPPPAGDLRAAREEAFGWVRAAAAQEPVRVVMPKPQILAWETGVPAMAPIQGTADETLGELCARGITHLVLPRETPGSPSPSGRMRVGHLAPARPDRFARLAENRFFAFYRFQAAACSSRAEPRDATSS